MMVIKNLRNYKFKDEIGIYSTTGFALYEDGKGFISLDGKNPYSPAGGKKALQSILNAGGFLSEPDYILLGAGNPLNRQKGVMYDRNSKESSKYYFSC